MADVELLGYKISKINMVNNISETGSLQLTNYMEFKIDYTKDNESAEATLFSCTEHKDTNIFHLNLEIQAIFRVYDIKGNDEKEEVKHKCYDELFYCLEEIMTYLIDNTGIETFKLRKLDMIPKRTDSRTKRPNAKSSGEIIEFRTDV